jgi:hypothetical protein
MIPAEFRAISGIPAISIERSGTVLSQLSKMTLTKSFLVCFVIGQVDFYKLGKHAISSSQLIVRSRFADASIVEHDYLIRLWQKAQRICNK